MRITVYCLSVLMLEQLFPQFKSFGVGDGLTVEPPHKQTKRNKNDIRLAGFGSILITFEYILFLNRYLEQ